VQRTHVEWEGKGANGVERARGKGLVEQRVDQLENNSVNSPDMTADENAELLDRTNQRSGLLPIGRRKTTTLAYNREDRRWFTGTLSRKYRRIA
jgi:hypothetical protein